jgi:hypothetical protein
MLALQKIARKKVPLIHTFSFASKDLDAINLENILHQNSVKAKIPYFKYQAVPII